MAKSDDWNRAARRFANERRGELGGKAFSDELLDAFFRGELSDEQAEPVRELLALYPELALEAAGEGPPSVGPGDAAHLSTAERRAGWEDLAARLGLAEAGEAPVGVALRPTGVATRPPWRPWGLPIAAGLVAATVGLFLLLSTGQPAVLNPQRLFPDPTPRGGQPVTEPTPLAAPVNREFMLVLSLPWPNPALLRYQVELVALPSSGEFLWRADDQVSQENGLLFLQIPRRRLPAGTYQLRVEGTDPAGGTTSARYTFVAP